MKKRSHRFILLITCTIVCFCISFAIATENAKALTGNILNTAATSSLVCHDIACTPASAGKLNWLPTLGGGITAVSIDDSLGLSGNVWGNEIGWINLKPSGQGVVVDMTTGSTTGYAWSGTCGWINFAPTNYGVKIVTLTAESGSSGTGVGQFSGFAWCGGDNGGWIKFDCSVAGNSACVKTNWVKSADRYVAPTGGGGGSSGGGTGGGGGIVTLPATTPTTAGQIANDSGYSTQTGPQNQTHGDYSGLYRADIDDDTSVGILDFNLLMVNWSKKQAMDLTLKKPDRCLVANKADINCDGKVDVLDFNVLMIQWGKKLIGSKQQ